MQFVNQAYIYLYLILTPRTFLSDRSGVGFPMVSLEFFRSHYGPGVDTASNRNEYHVYFLGVQAAGA